MTEDEMAALPTDDRQALKDDLWGQGVPDAQAEAWLERWDAEAETLGIPADDPAYWRLAAAWIDAERESD